MRVFCDIDGTLTTVPGKRWGEPLEKRIANLKQLIVEGHQVVLWTGGGTKYARRFAEKYGIEGAVCIGKPTHCIDDNPNIRPKGRIKILEPTVLDEEWQQNVQP